MRIVEASDLAAGEESRRHATVCQRCAEGVEILGLRIREWAKQHAVDCAEDCRRRADAKRERADRREWKRRRATKISQRKPDVLREGRHSATTLAGLPCSRAARPPYEPRFSAGGTGRLSSTAIFPFVA